MTKFALIVGGILLWNLGCGGGSMPATTSGVSESKPVNQLTTDDLGKICDWSASLYGGYGKTKTCSDGTTSSSRANRDACVQSTYKTCTATVSDVESCTLQLHELCLSGLATQECEPLLPCL